MCSTKCSVNEWRMFHKWHGIISLLGQYYDIVEIRSRLRFGKVLDEKKKCSFLMKRIRQRAKQVKCLPKKNEIKENQPKLWK